MNIEYEYIEYKTFENKVDNSPLEEISTNYEIAEKWCCNYCGR